MKNLKSLGEILNKQEQQSINGGASGGGNRHPERCDNAKCPPGYCCGNHLYFCVVALPGGRNCR